MDRSSIEGLFRSYGCMAHFLPSSAGLGRRQRPWFPTASSRGSPRDRHLGNRVGARTSRQAATSSISHAEERHMRVTKIRTVDQAEQARATSIQLMAFAADPIMRWMWPEPDGYVSHFPALLRGFGGRAFEQGTAHVTDDFHGGAL